MSKETSLNESITDILNGRKISEEADNTETEENLKEYDEPSGRRSKEFKALHTIQKYDHDDMEGIGEEEDEDDEDDEEYYDEDLEEATLAGIALLVKEYDYGIVTGTREAEDCGKGREYSDSENKARNAEVKRQLEGRGYSVTPIKGYKTVEKKRKKKKDEEETEEEEKTVEMMEVFTEDAFFAVDMDKTGNLRRDIVRLGERFEQDTVIFGKAKGPAFLIGTNDCPTEPARGESFEIGHFRGGKSGAYFSKVRDRPFVFESYEEAYDLILEGVYEEYETDDDDDIDEKRMSSKAKKQAAKYRRKNKRKLQKYRKKRARKLKSGSIRVDKKRSRQMKKARKKPGISEAKLKKGKNDPCWKGYVQVGTKMKNGKEVPNCVPIKDAKKKRKTKKEESELAEKAVSKSQKKLMSMAYAVKKGDMSRDEASEEVKRLADTMSMSDLKDYAKTDQKGLPQKKEYFEESVSDDLMAVHNELEDVGLPRDIMNSLMVGEMPDPDDVEDLDKIDRDMLLAVLAEVIGRSKVERRYGADIPL